MRRRVWMAALLIALGALSWGALTARAQTVDDQYGFFSFWQANGGEPILGRPLTDPLEENGLTVQYFERARLEYHPDGEEPVRLGLIGRERNQWRTFPPQPAGSEDFRPDGSDYTLRGPFRSFWETNGGAAIFGMPMSPPLWENTPTGRFQVQYFERAQFIHHPLYAGQPGEIELAPLGRELAAAHGLIEGSIGTSPELFSFEPVAPAPVVTAAPAPDQPEVEQAAAQNDKPAPEKPAAPKPADAPKAPQAPNDGKSIEVDLSKQWLYAYENGEQVFNAPVATGKDGFNTPAGSYAIYAKVPLQTMRGSINGETWVVPNVPHAMYFNGSVALHGTYWHNLFGTGTRISHGCVNLPLDAAAWLYDWARVGTPVEVHY